MPERKTVEKAKQKLREGRSPSTAAGEFVREEIDHVREGKHGARSAKQAIAIGLSKARRVGIPLPTPKRASSPKTIASAKRDARTGRMARMKSPSATRSRATKGALERESYETTSKSALAAQTRSEAASRGAGARSQSAKKAVKTKGPATRRAAARKAATTRKRRV